MNGIDWLVVIGVALVACVVLWRWGQWWRRRRRRRGDIQRAANKVRAEHRREDEGGT